MLKGLLNGMDAPVASARVCLPAVEDVSTTSPRRHSVDRACLATWHAGVRNNLAADC